MKEEEGQGEQIGYKLEESSDLDPLFERIGDEDNTKYVLLGEASHGTSEFYNWRIEITKRLIKEHKFSFIAVEGDWHDCYNVNRYVKGIPLDYEASNAYDVLYSFNRWPTWMFVEWLRKYNQKLPEDDVVQ